MCYETMQAFLTRMPGLVLSFLLLAAMARAQDVALAPPAPSPRSKAAAAYNEFIVAEQAKIGQLMVRVSQGFAGNLDSARYSLEALRRQIEASTSAVEARPAWDSNYELK